MIIYTYDPWLVAASILVSMMASFTGLTLTRGISRLVESQKQLRIVMAAIALGGGVWSMHFVAMLAMRFPVPVYYDLLPTTASVLIAILLAGLALILMHFGPRTRPRKLLAGAILGLGIVVMHYVGLSAIDGCAPVYDSTGFVIVGLLAVGMGAAAIFIAYSRRTRRNTLLATLVFGASVAVVHFGAMTWTEFVESARRSLDAPAIANADIALLVLLAGFLISGAFLLAAASFLNRSAAEEDAIVAAGDAASPPAADGIEMAARPSDVRAPQTAPIRPVRVPYEKEGSTFFVPADEVFAVRAEGHYTIAYIASGRVFCPWSISEAEKRLPAAFLRVHRSYLVNAARVSGFERRKDNGFCLFDGSPSLERVPVARSRIPALREALGLA
ncbi:MAG: LytTR family transcriptional regulator DNA-binding domain-containing protein [Microvirga sp.]|nr:LytTR family transcriptional regulator DNA-binding domain-containing protein [Microvirga sp.]